MVNSKDQQQRLFGIIVLTNLELHRLLCKVVEICAVNHPKSSSKDPKVAFREVLEQLKSQVKAATQAFSAKKLFTTSDRDAFLSAIEINVLDSGLILKILLKVEEFLQISRILSSPCGNGHEKCCVNCDHSSPVCDRCISGSGKPSKKCKHKCKNCSQELCKCFKYKTLCCGKCKLCLECNEKFAVNQIHVLTQKTFSTQQQPCPFFLFLYCLDESLKWRNLFGHVTLTELQDFLDKSNPTSLTGFEMSKTLEELQGHMESVVLVISEFISDAGKFPKNTLQEEEKHKFQKEFSLLFKAEEFDKYWRDKGKEIEEIFRDAFNKLKNNIMDSEERMIDIFKNDLGT